MNQPLVPGSAVPGGPGFTLTVNGCNFATGATVLWNGSALTTTFISGIQLTATVPASHIATAGTAVVTVNNPGGSTSFPAFFTITNPSTAVGFFPQYIATISGETPVNALIVGDFNGDNKPDLLVGTSAPYTVTVYLNNGDGTFTPLAPFTPPGVGSTPIIQAAADVNNDGKLDLIGTGQNGSINVLFVMFGNGDGTFRSGPTSPTSTPPIVLGDFNGDGNLDLISPDPGTGNAQIQLGNGDSTFQSPVTVTVGNIEWGGAAAGDFNRDGSLDVDFGAVFVAYGAGNGTFPIVISLGPVNNFTAAADLNGDDILDIVGVNEVNGLFSVFLGNNGGTFTQSTFSYPIPAVSFALADFNGDGIPDLAVGAPYLYGMNAQAGQLSVFLGKGDGTFGREVDYAIASGQPLPADFNGDGKLDLATVSSSRSCDGDGSNCPPSLITVLLQTTAQFSVYSLAFPMVDVGQTGNPQNITLTNVGTGSLAITSVSLGGPNPGDFKIQSNSCGAVLAAGANCVVGVVFSPTTYGNRSATLTFSDGAVASPQSIPMTAIGGPLVGNAQISPTSLSFASQPIGTTSPAQTVTVTNTGSANLLIGDMGFFGQNPNDFSLTNGCLETGGLPPGSSCQIGVTFTPQAVGARSGTLEIYDTAPGSPQNVPVSGTGGSSPGLEVASGSSSSATVAAGTTAKYTLQIGGGGMSGTATLTCSGAPLGATCSLPGSESVSATSASEFTVSVSTMERTSSALTGRSLEMWAMLLFGLVVLPTSGRKNRRALLHRASLSLLLILFISSCGGGGASRGTGGTPAGTYNLTVAASMNGTMQSQVLKLTVQ